MGGIRPLVELLNTQGGGGGMHGLKDWAVTLQSNAAFAIASICRANEANQYAIADLGGLPRLGMLLKPGGGAYSSTYVGPPAMVEAEAVRIGDVFCSLLAEISPRIRRGSDNAGLASGCVARLWQAGALWALSEGHDANKVSIAGAGAIPTLCELLGSANERAQRHAASALASLALGKPGNQEQVTGLLVQRLSQSSDHTQKRTARAVRS